MLNDSAPAIVLSHGPGGLGTVRSLARRGIKVLAIAFEASDLVLHSRFPVHTIVVPGDNNEEKERHVLGILNSLPNNDSVLMATSDRLVSLISDHRNDLHNKFHFKLPPKETLDALNDKSKETELIGRLGFDVPKTIVKLPPNPDELEQQLRFPIIFKPHSFSKQEIFSKKNEVVRNQSELRDFYKHWAHALPALLAQEVIPGPDDYSWVCSCTYNRNYDLLDCLVRQKLRTIPAHFGTSTFSVSGSNDEVVELARKLGKKLKYVGHAGIEFRWDDRDKRYKYIEVNPRIGGEVSFDEACGLPTVWNSYMVSMGRDAAHSGSMQVNNIYFVNLRQDISSLLQDKTPATKILTIHLTLFFKRTSGQYFVWDDPVPGIVVAFRFIMNACRKIYEMIRLKFSASKDS